MEKNGGWNWKIGEENAVKLEQQIYQGYRDNETKFTKYEY